MTRGLNMLGHAVAAAALAATAGAVSSDAAGARHRHTFHCRFAERHTIAATRQARVYSGHAARSGNIVIGCLYGSTRRVVLGPNAQEVAPIHVQIAGRYVGFFLQTSDPRSSSGPDAEVDVVDLKFRQAQPPGKRRHRG